MHLRILGPAGCVVVVMRMALVPSGLELESLVRLWFWTSGFVLRPWVYPVAYVPKVKAVGHCTDTLDNPRSSKQTSPKIVFSEMDTLLIKEFLQLIRSIIYKQIIETIFSIIKNFIKS